MKIRDIMNPNVAAVRPDDRFNTLLRKQADMPSRLLYVTDEAGKLLGVLSGYDLLKVMVPFYLDANLAKALTDDSGVAARAYEENKDKTAEELMTRKVHALSPDDTFLEAESLIAETGVNVLPVLDVSGKLLGEVARREVLCYLIQKCGCRCD